MDTPISPAPANPSIQPAVITKALYDSIKDRLNLSTDAQKALYKERIEICSSCDRRKGFRCGACGCILSLKVRSSSKCPMGKW